jgi:hypothetical protein
LTGWADPWPLQWGGGPSLIESVYAATNAVIGKGHGADGDGIEQRWREARAVGLGCLAALIERGANQSYPKSSADLGQWRRSFFLPDSMHDEEVRRESMLRLFADDTGSIPDLDEQLKRIDPRFSIVQKDWTDSLVTMAGRYFESFENGPPFGTTAKETQYPNRASSYELVILFDLGSPVSPVGVIEQAAVQTARDYLQDSLPAYYDFTIVTSVGMLAGTSPSAWTVF